LCDALLGVLVLYTERIMQAKMAKEVEDIDRMKVQRTALQAELNSD